MRKLMVVLLSGVLCFLGTTSALAVKYDEVPMLRARVAAGELPPMDERLPEEPYVVQPVERVGDYGGTLRTVTMTAGSWGEDLFLMDVMVSFLKVDKNIATLLPNLAKKIDASDDMTTFTFYMRKGVKWSDGYPFTTEDVMFWYEDVLQNEELTPVIRKDYRPNDELLKIEALDEYTFRVTLSAPSPYFLSTLVWLFPYTTWYAPKHYLMQFHPRYTSEEELEEMTEEAGFDNWYQLFQNKTQSLAKVPMKVGLPTLNAYLLLEINPSMRIYERNPYYWKVDTDGNQLPYLDRIETEIVSDVEVVKGKLMSGEADFGAFYPVTTDYPLFKQFEDTGGYRVILWADNAVQIGNYTVNMTHKDPVLRKIFQDRRFRIALSLAIDRDEINDVITFGKAIVTQTTIVPGSKLWEPAFANAYIEYDPDRSRELLDEMGLKDTDGDGWRERSDGDTLTFTIEFPQSGGIGVTNDLVVAYWQEIGIDVRTKMISPELQWQRVVANELDATIHGELCTDILFPANRGQMFVPVGASWERTMWPAWDNYYTSDGAKGEKPPAEIQQLVDWYKEMLVEPSEERRIELGKNILRSQAENLWNIGTVGFPPHVVVADNDLRNVPEDVLFGWSAPHNHNRDMEQVFFIDGVNKE